MSKKLGKILSVMLAVALLAGSVNVPVYATEADNTQKEVISTVDTVEEEPDAQAAEYVLTDENETVTSPEIEDEDNEQQIVEESEEIIEDETFEETADEDEVIEVSEEMDMSEETESDTDENEIQSGSYSITFLANGEEDTYHTLIYSIYYGDGYGLDENEMVGGNDLYFMLGVSGILSKVQYKIGDGVYKTAELKVLNYEGFYYIPKSEITGDVTVNVITRELYTNVPVSFNDEEGSHYKVKYNESIDHAYWELTESPGATFKADECCGYSFVIVPEEGYKVRDVVASAGIIRKLDEENCYTFEMNSLNSEIAPTEIKISVLIAGNDQKFSKFIYDDEAVDIRISLKSDDSEVVPPYSLSDKFSDGRIDAYYVLKEKTEYKVVITPRTGYSFNEYGVCAHTVKDDGSYIWGSHVNTNTTKPYTFTFTAGSREVWVNTKAVYAPVVVNKQNGTTLQAVNNVYNVSYLNVLGISMMKAASEISPSRIVIKDGSKVLSDSDNNELVFDKSAYGRKLTVELYDTGIDKSVAKFYLQVSTPVTSVKVAGVKVVSGKQTLSPAIGDEIACALGVNAGASVDDLDFKVTDNDFIDVQIDGGKLIIKAAENKRAGQTAIITLYDKKNAVNWDEQNIANGTVVVTTTVPVWTKTAPTASLAAATDISLRFNVTAPKITGINDKYYVAVKLVPNRNTKIPEEYGLTLNEDVEYFQVVDGKIPAVTVNTFKYGPSTKLVGLGYGLAAKMDAEIYMVLTSDGDTPVAGDDGNIVTSTVVKKLSVATKTPYYADKITLKKAADASKLYAGQSAVKVADINLGTNTTYNTTEYWDVKKIVDAKGTDVTSNFTIYKGDAYGNSNTDTGIYVAVGEHTPAGKYKLTVQTVPYASEATVEITVLPTIQHLEISVDGIDIHGYGTNYLLYKAKGKASSSKITVYAEDQECNEIKNPKVKYIIGEYDSSADKINPVANLTANNGKITISKDFVVDAETEKTYVLAVEANDFSDNTVSQTVEIDIHSTPVDVNKLELYTYDSLKKEYALVGNRQIPIDVIDNSSDLWLCYAIKNKSGEYIVGGDGTGEKKPVKVQITSYDSVSGVAYLDTDAAVAALYKLTKPGKVTFTAYGLDGTKASAGVNVTYPSFNQDFNSVYYITESGKDGTACIADDTTEIIDLNDYPAGETIELYLSDETGENVTYFPDWDESYLVEGSLSVTNAKILKKNSNSQYLKIQMTKSPATVTLTKKDDNGKAVKTIWTIVNDACNKTAAPAAASVLVNDKDKVYADYDYLDNTDYLIVTLKEPIKDADRKVIDADKVEAYISNSVGIICGSYGMEKVSYAIEGGKAKVIIPLAKYGTERLESGKISFNIYYNLKDTTDYLTKSPTAVSVTPAKFTKSFTLNATQTMSFVDAYNIVPTYKGVGVKSAVMSYLLDYNSKGEYNDFTSIYEIDPYGRISLKDGGLDILGVDAKGVPKSCDGYIAYDIMYDNGDWASVICKVTIKWTAAATKKYSSVMASTIKAPSVEDSLVVVSPVKVGSTDAVVRFAKLAKDDANFVAAGPNDGGTGVKLVLSDKSKIKTGAYKTDVMIITDESGYKGSEPTAEDYAKYGIKVSVSVKVTD